MGNGSRLEWLLVVLAKLAGRPLSWDECPWAAPWSVSEVMLVRGAFFNTFLVSLSPFSGLSLPVMSLLLRVLVNFRGWRLTSLGADADGTVVSM